MATSVYLARVDPEKIPELDLVFDATYRAVVNERTARDDAGGSGMPQRGTDTGLPFGPASVRRTLVNAAVWLADQLLRVALARGERAAAVQALEKLSVELGLSVGDPEMGRALRRLVDEAVALEPWTAQRPPGEAREVPVSPDLLLLVHEAGRGGETRLVYHAYARDPSLGLAFRRFVSEPIRRDPTEFCGRFFDEVRDLSERPPDIAVAKLAAWGHRLFEMLLPLDLRRTFWSLRHEVGTVQVVSEESWIPWEILKLRDPADRGAAGEFFAEAFALARWLPGFAMTPDLPLRSVALVVPRDSELPDTAAERELVRSLPGRTVVEVPGTFVEVTEALSKGLAEGWHFTGHGVAHGENPDQWGLELEDYEVLTVSDLHGLPGPSGPTRPFVFLNACHSMRSGVSLVGGSGLADAFLAAGAGAVLGSHWAISDARATEFAAAFYRRFVAGGAVAEAVRQARLEVRDSHPGDPAWLAYTVYAHPSASCLESHSSPVSAESSADSGEALANPRSSVPSGPITK